MNKSNVFIAAILLMFMLNPVIFSQGNLSFNIGAALPLSEFADDDIDDEDAGAAATGFNIGLQYVYPVTDNGLGLFGGIDLMYNGLTDDYKDDLEDNIFIDEINSFSKYINIPISAGINYTYGASKSFSVFGNAGLAANFLKKTDYKYTIVYLEPEYVEAHKTAFKLGFKVGGGIIVNDKISVSINYYGLGEHILERTISDGDSSEDLEEDKQEVNILTLGVGIRF